MKCKRSDACHAFTLIEVLAGMVLLAGVVSTTLVAISSHRRASELLGKQRSALLAADALLSEWYQSSAQIPVPSQGAVGIGSDFFWRTRRVGTQQVCGVWTDTIRLEIMVSSLSQSNTPPLATIDVLQRSELR